MKNIENLELVADTKLEGFKRINSFDIPEELSEAITKDAKLQRRTFRAQVLFVLEQYYKDQLRQFKMLKDSQDV